MHSELKHRKAQRNKFKLTVKSTGTDKIIKEFDIDFGDLSEDEIKELAMNEYKKLLPNESLSISNEAAIREDFLKNLDPHSRYLWNKYFNLR
ncbi:MAG: hypothetical protein E6Q32_04420 [Neisseriales bacterium]|nr:MAG: hypothetical protein E6Q32_04420 [Neisseriales bacterium]